MIKGKLVGQVSQASLLTRGSQFDALELQVEGKVQVSFGEGTCMPGARM